MRSTIIRVALFIAGITASLLLDPGAVFFVPILFLLVVPFEKLFPRHEQRVRRPELGLDIRYGILAPALALVGTIATAAIGVVSLAWLPGLLLAPLVGLLPGWAQIALGVLLFDLAIYWIHRFSHEVPFMWRFHAVHHSSSTLDWASAFRNHPFDGALAAPAAIFLLAAGFSPELTGILVVVQLAVGIFFHANVSWRWRALDKVLVTPEFHHWHHVDEPDAINRNYGVLLPIWDLVFGTFWMPKDRRPASYGITEELPMTIIGQFRAPLEGLPTVRWTLRHPVLATRRTYRAVRRGLPQVWAVLRSARQPVLTEVG